jgi:hypothetical protein
MKYFWLILLPCLAFGQMSRKSESSVVNLYEKKVAKTHARYLTVEVGDSTRTKFDPSFKISAWDGECEFRLHLSTSDKPLGLATRGLGTMNGKDKTTLTTAGVQHEMYVRDDGNFEWEIIFSSKPDTNVFTYQIKTKGLNFHYQPELTQKEVDDGMFRPASVIGSYAVYHNSKANNRIIIEGKDTTFENYKTGKAFHIYRPRAWDASGDTVWGVLEIDLGRMTIGVDSTWMANATYPITIDPTFGYTTDPQSWVIIDATSFLQWGTTTAGLRHTASTGDEVTAFSCYSQATGSAVRARYAVYAIDDSCRVGDTVVSNSIPVDGQYLWRETSGVSKTLTNGNTYIVALCKHDGGTFYTRYDTGGSIDRISRAGVAVLTACFAILNVEGTELFGLYATYTAGGGGATGQVIIIQ